MQTGLHSFFGISSIKKMPVGGGHGEDPALTRVGNHIQELGVNKGFSLEIKGEVDQIVGDFIYYFPEQLLVQVSGGTGKGTQAAGTFGAAQITGCGWLYRKTDGKGQLLIQFCTSGFVIGMDQFSGIQYLFAGEDPGLAKHSSGLSRNHKWKLHSLPRIQKEIEELSDICLLI